MSDILPHDEADLMMSSDEGYEVVFRFLDQFWAARKPEYDDDLPSLLGSMSRGIWADRTPGDPAYTEIWQESSIYKTELTTDEAFQALIRLLEDYIAKGQGPAQDIGRTLAEIQHNPATHRRIFDQIAQEVTAQT